MVLLEQINNKLLIFNKNTFNQIDLETLNDKTIEIPLQNSIKNPTKIKEVNIVTISKNQELLGISTDDKRILLYEITTLNLIDEFIISRVASKMIFTSSKDLVVADRTGDVYLYKLSNGLKDPILLLGHLSMVLDVALSSCSKYIISCDRDEKIRVSHFPNAYNIQSYCLGHKEFVIKLLIIDNYLVSASGDGTIRYWDFINGKQLALIDTNDNIIDKTLINDFEKSMKEKHVFVNSLPIIDVQINHINEFVYILAQLHLCDGLQLYKTVLNNFNTVFIKIVLSNQNISTFSLNKHLIIIDNNYIKFYKFLEDDYFINENNKLKNYFDHFNMNFYGESYDELIDKLYKTKFDNVKEYLTRKKVRLEQKE